MRHSAQDPSWFFGQAEKPVQHTTAKEVSGETARALLAKGMALGNTQEAIQIYDEVITRFSGTTKANIRKHLAEALVNKGMVLGSLGRVEEAIAVCDEVISRFGEAKETTLKEQVAEATAGKEVLEASFCELKEQAKREASVFPSAPLVKDRKSVV